MREPITSDAQQAENAVGPVALSKRALLPRKRGKFDDRPD